MPSGRSKGSLSGLEFRVLSRELSASLVGAYVSNIYSIGESQLLILKRSAEQEGSSAEFSLMLSPRLGAWLTESPTRVETTEFTTALRSYLLRAKLEGVSQFDLDRVLTLRFKGKAEEGQVSLVLELMPPGNIVLTGKDEKILLGLREVRTPARRLAKGYPYSPPTQTRASLETITEEDIAKALAGEKTMGRALGRGLSVPRRYVDEILDRTSHNQGDPPDSSADGVHAIMTAVKGILEEIETRPSPCLVRFEGEGSSSDEVMVVRPVRREVVETAPNLSALLDRLLLPEILETESLADARRATTPTGGGGEAPTDVHERRAAEFKATIDELESKKAGLLRLVAGLRGLAASTRAAPDTEQALALVRSMPTVPSDLLSSIESLAPRGQASISSAIFDRAKKAETEVKDIDGAVRGLKSKLKKESVRMETTSVKAIPLSRKKKEWYEKFRWFFTTGGRLAVGGRDAQSNTTLIRRHMQDGDTVYHADLFGSPFFILKGGKEQGEEEIKEVAKATVTFSSAWKTGLGAADAYWVSPDQVGSAGPSGEYLAHGSFAIKGKKNFVTKNPVEVAVGVDGIGRIVSGPEEAIMKVAKAHVAIIPSRDKPSDTAKKVLHELGPYGDPAVALAVDDVLRMLPAGGGKITRRRVDVKTATATQVQGSARPPEESPVA